VGHCGADLFLRAGLATLCKGDVEDLRDKVGVGQEGQTMTKLYSPYNYHTYTLTAVCMRGSDYYYCIHV
jgi:hypothetical protein